MASELDDFFAKKEKKKKKTKGKKFATTDEIVKTIDTTDSETADNTANVLEKTTSSNTKVVKPAKQDWSEQLAVGCLCCEYIVWRRICMHWCGSVVRA